MVEILVDWVTRQQTDNQRGDAGDTGARKRGVGCGEVTNRASAGGGGKTMVDLRQAKGEIDVLLRGIHR